MGLLPTSRTPSFPFLYWRCFSVMWSFGWQHFWTRNGNACPPLGLVLNNTSAEQRVKQENNFWMCWELVPFLQARIALLWDFEDASVTPEKQWQPGYILQVFAETPRWKHPGKPGVLWGAALTQDQVPLVLFKWAEVHRWKNCWAKAQGWLNHGAVKQQAELHLKMEVASSGLNCKWKCGC